MKAVLTKIGAIFVASFILCIVVQAQQTSAAFDEKVDFSNYKTFAFDKDGARNPYVNTLIVEAVERELTSRGLVRVNNDLDLKVVYLAATVPNLQVQNVPFYHVVNPAYSGKINKQNHLEIEAYQNPWKLTNIMRRS